MNRRTMSRWTGAAVHWLPLLCVAGLMLLFGLVAPRFLTADNLIAILVQSSWLIVLALGVNLVLLTGGVDLSAGATMFLAVVILAILVPGMPLWLWPVAACAIGALAGAINGLLVTRGRIPAFVATLALAFIIRGAGLIFSETQMVFAPPAVAEFGRSSLAGATGPLWAALLVALLCWLVMRRTLLGLYVRAVGADAEGARRAGIPVAATLATVYMSCGALAGLAGFLSFSQTSAATTAFGANAEFLAIAAAVLGGTSLFGGRGSLWAPILGAVLITTVQNGLVMIDADPYAYPVVTGAVILFAALLDGLRRTLAERAERRDILGDKAETDGCAE